MNSNITIRELLAQLPLPTGVSTSISAIETIDYDSTKALQKKIRETANQMEYDAGIEKMMGPTEAILECLCRIHDLLIRTCPDRSFDALHAKGPSLAERSM